MRRNIDQLVEMGYDGVILTGGEPSTSELLLPALAYARERKLFSRMITNGQKLADKDFFKRCVDAGLTHIHVSLHSYRREVHDFITQYRGAWDVLVRCLENVPEMGITSDINTVINVWNCRPSARERPLDLRELPVHPPLRLEQHGPRRQSRRGESRLHPAALRVPGVAREGDGLPREHRAELPRRARPALLHAALTRGPRRKRARSSRKRSAASASSTSRASSTRRSSCTARVTPARRAASTRSVRACSRWRRATTSASSRRSSTTPPTVIATGAETRAVAGAAWRGCMARRGRRSMTEQPSLERRQQAMERPL